MSRFTAPTFGLTRWTRGEAFRHAMGCTPRGSRIPVASVKRRCPRPLDDGGAKMQHVE